MTMVFKEVKSIGNNFLFSVFYQFAMVTIMKLIWYFREIL